HTDCPGDTECIAVKITLRANSPVLVNPVRHASGHCSGRDADAGGNRFGSQVCPLVKSIRHLRKLIPIRLEHYGKTMRWKFMAPLKFITDGTKNGYFLLLIKVRVVLNFIDGTQC